jgi:hypothetical protein
MNKGVQNLTNKPRQTGNVTVYELLISSLAMTDALAKLLIEKGSDHPRRIYAEDFRGAGNVSKTLQSYAAMTQISPFTNHSGGR